VTSKSKLFGSANVFYFFAFLTFYYTPILGGMEYSFFSSLNFTHTHIYMKHLIKNTGETYRLLKIVNGSVINGQCTTCDNCEKIISNIATIQNVATGEIHKVGTDCAKNLTNNSVEFQDNYTLYSQVQKFLAFAAIDSNCDALVISYLDKKEKRKEEMMYLYLITPFFSNRGKMAFPENC
jgi:hypothetical protein